MDDAQMIRMLQKILPLEQIQPYHRLQTKMETDLLLLTNENRRNLIRSLRHLKQPIRGQLDQPMDTTERNPTPKVELTTN